MKKPIELSQELSDTLRILCYKITEIPSNDPRSLQRQINDVRNLFLEYFPDYSEEIKYIMNNINVDNVDNTEYFYNSRKEFLNLINRENLIK